MTEEEQIAFAMQMSMQDHGKYCNGFSSISRFKHITTIQQNPIAAEEVPTQQAKRPKQEEQPMEVDEVITDPDFLQSVLENLPGVDPQSETIRDAVGSLNKDKKPANKDSSNDK